MSRNQSAAGRFSLLAGSSLVAASLSMAVSIGVAVAPSTASAQSVCTPTPTSGAGTNVVSYTGTQANLTCTATGDLTINKLSGNATGTITVTTTGRLTLINDGRIGFTSPFAVVNFSGVAGGVTFINKGGANNGNAMAGQLAVTGAYVFSNGDDVLTFQGRVTNEFRSGSSVSFGNGNDTLNVEGVNLLFDTGNLTATASTINFDAGDDVLNVSGTMKVSGGTINFGAGADRFDLTGLAVLSGVGLDFGTGADAINITDGGKLLLDGVNVFSGLEAFNNAAAILLGGRLVDNLLPSPLRINKDESTTDGAPATVLRLSSGVFTGLEGSRIFMDANLGSSGSQLDCGTPTVADCANFTGATTAGTTLLNVRDNTFSVDGGTLGVVVTLVQGATAGEHFLLDPASRYYADTPNGQAIRKPVVAYTLVYDADTKRHVLIGAPSSEMFEVGTYAASAQELWRATTGSWLTRQADLRVTPGGLQSGGSVWGRIGGQTGERELDATYQTQGLSLDYDLAHKQRIAHLVFGADFLGATTADSAWVLGGMIGYARSDVEFEATPTEAVTTGVAGGLYGSYVAGPFFVDGVFNANVLHMTVDAPAMNLGLDVPMKFDVTSLGGQVEAGWRFGMGSGFFFEPLAGASYIVTRIDDTEVPGGSGQFDFEEAKSLRLGGGARVGMDGELLGMSASYSLTGRYWNESEGEGGATVTTASGSSADLPGDFSGGFGEVGASLGLYSPDGGVSGFVNLGGKFADGYQSIDGSVGVRVRW